MPPVIGLDALTPLLPSLALRISPLCDGGGMLCSQPPPPPPNPVRLFNTAIYNHISNDMVTQRKFILAPIMETITVMHVEVLRRLSRAGCAFARRHKHSLGSKWLQIL